MKTYNVELTTTLHNEMSVKAPSPEEARNYARKQLKEMGWTEWEVGDSWEIKDDRS